MLEAAKTRMYCMVVDIFDAHGARAGALHTYSKLRCGHLVDHGILDRIDRPLPKIGDVVCCRACTRKARGR